jgi:hypothetical protein
MYLLDFAGQCLLWWVSSLITFVAPALDLPTIAEWVLHSSVLQRLVCDGTAAETECHKDMGYFYGDSKTDLKLQCECWVKFLLFKGTHDVCSIFDGCVLHIIALQPLKSVPEPQETLLWAPL